MTPKITIVTICFNEELFIEKTLLSVINQTYSNKEYIVIDGGSIDQTTNILQKYSNSFAYWISERDNGIYDAWNKGISHATGEYTIFLQGGDTFYNKNILENVSPYLGNKNIDVLYGSHEYIDDMTKKTQIFEVRDINTLTKSLPFCPSAAFFKTSLIQKLKFNTNYRISGDYDMVARIYSMNYNFQFIQLPIIKFSPGGISTKVTLRLIIEDYRAQRNITNNFSLKINVVIRIYILFKEIIKTIIRNYSIGRILINIIRKFKI